MVTKNSFKESKTKNSFSEDKKNNTHEKKKYGKKRCNFLYTKDDKSVKENTAITVYSPYTSCLYTFVIKTWEFFVMKNNLMHDLGEALSKYIEGLLGRGLASKTIKIHYSIIRNYIKRTSSTPIKSLPNYHYILAKSEQIEKLDDPSHVLATIFFHDHTDEIPESGPPTLQNAMNFIFKCLFYFGLRVKEVATLHHQSFLWEHEGRAISSLAMCQKFLPEHFHQLLMAQKGRDEEKEFMKTFHITKNSDIPFLANVSIKNPKTLAKNLLRPGTRAFLAFANLDPVFRLTLLWYSCFAAFVAFKKKTHEMRKKKNDIEIVYLLSDGSERFVHKRIEKMREKQLDEALERMKTVDGEEKKIMEKILNIGIIPMKKLKTREIDVAGQIDPALIPIFNFIKSDTIHNHYTKIRKEINSYDLSFFQPVGGPHQIRHVGSLLAGFFLNKIPVEYTRHSGKSVYVYIKDLIQKIRIIQKLFPKILKCTKSAEGFIFNMMYIIHETPGSVHRAFAQQFLSTLDPQNVVVNLPCFIFNFYCHNSCRYLHH